MEVNCSMCSPDKINTTKINNQDKDKTDQLSIEHYQSDKCICVFCSDCLRILYVNKINICSICNKCIYELL